MTALDRVEYTTVIENPQPLWLSLLLIALPGIAFAAYALNKGLFPHDNRPLCTILAIGLVLALLPTHAIWGGLSTQASTWPSLTGDNDAYGLGEQKFAVRLELDKISPDWFDRLAAQHITWLAADADDVDINAILACPEAKSRAEFATQYGSLRIFKIH